MDEKLIKALKDIKIVRKEPVKLKNGEISEFYVDVKTAYGYPYAASLLQREVWYLMDKMATCIAGSGYGGIPLARDISSDHNLFLTMIRDKPKDHGLGGWLDGFIPTEKDKVAIVDDVFTTGGSLRDVIQKLAPTGAEIIGCYVVAKRGDSTDFKYPLKWVLTAEDLMS